MQHVETHQRYLVLDLLRHRQKGLLDVDGILGRGLEEGDADRVGKCLQPLDGGGIKRGHALAAEYSTARLPAKSLLLPTISFATPLSFPYLQWW